MTTEVKQIKKKELKVYTEEEKEQLRLKRNKQQLEYINRNRDIINVRRREIYNMRKSSNNRNCKKQEETVSE